MSSLLAETEPKPRRIGRRILVCTGVLAGLAAGCFQPKVVSGGLKCSIAAHICPEGFTCSDGLCVSDSAAAGGRSGGGHSGGGGASGASGAGGAGGAGGSETCARPIEPLCATASAPSSSGCDPVCQTGCGCGLRCNITASGNACAPPAGSKSVGQLCQLGADDCAPGFACLREGCGTDLGRCYRFCRDGSTCACARVATLPNGTSSGQHVCDLGDQDCDPYATAGCPDPALHCYVTGPSSTTCDCPSGVEGQEGATCSAINDCLPGLFCLQVAGVSQCRRLCRTSADCPNCMAFGAVSFCAP